MVVLGEGNQRTSAMGGCHLEIAISQRRVARRSAKSAAMTVSLLKTWSARTETQWVTQTARGVADEFKVSAL